MLNAQCPNASWQAVAELVMAMEAPRIRMSSWYSRAAARPDLTQERALCRQAAQRGSGYLQHLQQRLAAGVSDHLHGHQAPGWLVGPGEPDHRPAERLGPYHLHHEPAIRALELHVRFLIERLDQREPARPLREAGAGSRIKFNAQCSMPNAQCSMPNAQCPMLNAQCSIEKDQRATLNTQCSLMPAVRHAALSSKMHLAQRSGTRLSRANTHIGPWTLDLGPWALSIEHRALLVPLAQFR